MIPLSLGDIAGITGARLDQVADPAAMVTGPVIIDSRAAAPGRAVRRAARQPGRRARLRRPGGGRRGRRGAGQPAGAVRPR